MIGHHIAEGAGSFIEGASMLDTDSFSCRDLHVVDVIAIPEGLDDVVGEAEDQNVLYGLFAEIMIDAVDLIFVEDLLELLVELSRGLQVVAERLFDNNAGPMTVFFLGETCLAELLHDRGEKARGDGEIEKAISSGVVLLIDIGNLLR